MQDTEIPTAAELFGSLCFGLTCVLTLVGGIYAAAFYLLPQWRVITEFELFANLRLLILLACIAMLLALLLMGIHRASYRDS